MYANIFILQHKGDFHLQSTVTAAATAPHLSKKECPGFMARDNQKNGR
jgi:hypothetical protein